MGETRPRRAGRGAPEEPERRQYRMHATAHHDVRTNRNRKPTTDWDQNGVGWGPERWDDAAVVMA